MMKILVGLAALGFASTAYAQAPAPPAPKADCCEKMKAEGKKCCCEDMDKDHADHSKADKK
jgi:hypothetical protein